MAVVLMLCAMPFVTGSGYYMFQTFDDWSGSLPLVVIAFFQCIAVAWVYGNDKYVMNICPISRWPIRFIYDLCIIFRRLFAEFRWRDHSYVYGDVLDQHCILYYTQRCSLPKLDIPVLNVAFNHQKHEVRWAYVCGCFYVYAWPWSTLVEDGWKTMLTATIPLPVYGFHRTVNAFLEMDT